jgi:peptide/nickel transport system ATP-binding protein
MRGTKLETIPGTPPNLAQLPPGCAFAARCRYAAEVCRQGVIPVAILPSGATARCVRAVEAVAV